MRQLVPFLFLLGCGGQDTEAPAPSSAESVPEQKAPAEPVSLPVLPEGQVIEVDSESSRFEWVGAKITKEHPGGFTSYQGRVVLGADSKVLGTEFSIDLESVFSDSKKLTKHLKNTDFFDVATFATARFSSAELLAVDGDGTLVKGVLEFHGNTRSIEFPANITVDETAVTVVADFPLNRQDFGVSYPGKPDDLIKDQVQIKLNLSFPR